MTVEDPQHAACVDAWLDGADEQLTAAQALALLERASAALFRRAQATLGEVTMGAIVDRVYYVASERYPVLAAVTVGETGVSFDRLREQLEGGAAVDGARMLDAARFVLVELLTVVGNLTDQILTPALHAELAKVALEAPAPIERDDDDAGGGGNPEGARG